MKKIRKSQGFTLVELIIVITILAILGTIAFISLQGYSAQARDTTRISDIQNIKTSLELFSLNTGKYPLPDSGTGVLYDTELIWTQGTIGNTVSTNLSRNLNEKPTDPLTETEYTYSVINSETKYELLSIYETDLVSFSNLLNTTNAANLAYPKIDGNYNGVFVKTDTYYIPTPSIITSENLPLDFNINPEKITSQIITGGENNIAYSQEPAKINGLPNFTLQVFSGTISTKNDDNKEDLAQVLIDAYSGTLLVNEGIYKQIVETTLSTDLISLIDDVVLSSSTYTSTFGGDNNLDETPAESTVLVDYCELVGWEWVESTDDVNIGANKGNGFCISPTVDLNNTNEVNNGFDGISWNGWGDGDFDGDGIGDYLYFNGWAVDSIDDSGSNNSPWGQTKTLNSPNGYTCTSIGGSTKGFTNSSDIDNVYGEDTLENRMRYLSKYKNNHDNITHTNIDWIEFITTQPLNNHAIPALYLADCIDGKKDLGNTMNYTHIDDSIDEVTYTEYSTDVSISTYTPAVLNNITYQNRQKYLTAWTQKSGSHLPSAFSYINNNTAGGELLNGSTTDWDKYLDTSTARGEYQVACEKVDGSYGIIAGTEDNNITGDGEGIWLSAIGNTNGTVWGRGARIIGKDGCRDQSRSDPGAHASTTSARFVIRP